MSSATGRSLVVAAADAVPGAASVLNRIRTISHSIETRFRKHIKKPKGAIASDDSFFVRLGLFVCRIAVVRFHLRQRAKDDARLSFVHLFYGAQVACDGARPGANELFQVIVHLLEPLSRTR